jgi:hypothetical protein
MECGSTQPRQGQRCPCRPQTSPAVQARMAPAVLMRWCRAVAARGFMRSSTPPFLKRYECFLVVFFSFFFFFCKRGCTSIWAETSHNLCSVALGHVFPAAIKRTYAGVSESTPPHSPHIYSRSDYYRADKLEQTDAKELARAGAEATGGKKICCTPRILILCEALDKWAVLRDTRHEYFPCSLRIKILFLGGFLGRCRVGWLSENSTEKKSRKHISLRSTRRAPKAGM